jgi:YrbI family 3-deoxy-D-manno-octulosonate 8-phosphate phosphatase
VSNAHDDAETRSEGCLLATPSSAPVAGAPSEAGAIAIIPARGGSKGVPRKNLQLVGGVPLVARAIRACNSAAGVVKTVVTTDDMEIAGLAESEGAIVVWRSADLASDVASSESAILHALDRVEEIHGPIPHVTLFVQCTSPFIAAADLSRMIEVISKGEADSCLTAARSHRFLWRSDENGHSYGVNHDSSVRLRRQQLQPEYVETGAAYGFRTDQFREAGHRFFGRIAIVEVDPALAIEIDELEDLMISDALHRVRVLPGLARSGIPNDIRAVIFDFDGVMTDDAVFILSTGEEAVRASRSDGMGISRLKRETSIRTLVLSTERNPVVEKRCAKLQMECLQGIDDKPAVLDTWLSDAAIDRAHVVYMGNDLNDLECMSMVGFSVAPADAHPTIRKIANLVTTRRGGDGAVRELCELLIDAQTATM